MWWFTTWKLLKDAWPAFAMMGGVILLLVVGLMFTFGRGCSSPVASADHLETARDLILEQVAAERKKNDEKIMALEEELSALRFEVDQLDYEIAESVKEREEIHDAIDRAGSIDAIDRALKRGIPGVSGRRDR